MHHDVDEHDSHAQEGNEMVINDLRKITGVEDYLPKSANEIANRHVPASGFH